MFSLEWDKTKEVKCIMKRGEGSVDRRTFYAAFRRSRAAVVDFPFVSRAVVHVSILPSAPERAQGR
jgi:hypothetical protein